MSVFWCYTPIFSGLRPSVGHHIFRSYLKYRIYFWLNVTVFGKMKRTWKNKCVNLKVKMRLYEAIIWSTLLYSAEVWSLTATLTKRLNAAHHRWLRGILGISWKDKVTNEEVRTRTGQQSMDNILRERRLCWLGHVIRMDGQRIPQQALRWEVPGYKRDPSRPWTNWRSVVNKDLLKMGLTWEEAEVAALNRSEWRRSVAQCIHLDAGWIKFKVKVTVHIISFNLACVGLIQ